MTERKHAIHNPSSAGYWLHCGHWVHHKLAAEAAGENWNPESDASKRGHLLHDIAEKALPRILADPNAAGWGMIGVESHVLETIEEMDCHEAMKDNDVDQVVIALTAVLDVIDWVQDMDPDGKVTVICETAVPLSHEPDATGTVDVQIIGRDVYVVLDYKFGAFEVEADAEQFWVYASNAIRDLPPKREVYVGVVQPQLREEALLHRTNWDELIEFRGHVNHTVRKQREGSVYAPAEIATCSYCPFQARCVGYASLVMASSAIVLDARTDADIEWVVANRTILTNGIETLANIVKSDPIRFPDWSRKEVQNIEKWNPAIEQGEVAHQLRLQGVKDPYCLKPPAEIRAENPELASTVDKYVLDRGTHVRLYRPKSAPNLRAPIRTRELLDRDEPTPDVPAEATETETKTKTKRTK